MTTPKTDRRPPLYDGTLKRCGLCNEHKRRNEADFTPSYGSRQTADGLSIYCRPCFVTLIAVRRRRQLIARGGREALGKLRGHHLRSLAMLNILLSGRSDRATNADVVRLTLAELGRLAALPIVPTSDRKEEG